MTDILHQIDQHIVRLQSPRYRLKIPMGTRLDMEMTASLMELMRAVIEVAITLDDHGSDEGISGYEWDELATKLRGLEEQFNLPDDEPLAPHDKGRCY